jgi:hypothetical protein
MLRGFQPDDVEEAIRVTLFRVSDWHADGRLQKVENFLSWPAMCRVTGCNHDCPQKAEVGLHR